MNEKQQIATRININLLKLYRIQGQISKLQLEIDEFSAQYFAQITLQLAPYFKHHDCSLQEEFEQSPTNYTSDFEQLLKQLYRALAKEFHPDLQRVKNADYMVSLNQAYQNKQLGSLIMLGNECGLSGDILSYSLIDLQHYSKLIEQNLASATQFLWDLEQSDANILRSNVLQAKLHGRNMIAEIIFKMKNKYQQIET